MTPGLASRITVVLLAGGRGTRIRALYPDVPKPMIPVAGAPFLHWVTAYFAHHGLRDFVYSTGHLGDQIARWSSDSSMPPLVRRACREHEPLGTGGGLINCLADCREWILAANADSLCLGGIPQLLGLVDRTQCAAGIVALHCDDTSRYGSLDIDATNRLTGFHEKMPGRGLINAGTYLFRRDALAELALPRVCSLEQDVFPALIASGARIDAVPLPDAPFIDIGTPETVTRAEQFVRDHTGWFTW